MSRPPKLDDVRQIGPGSERFISGVCSVCGTVVLARLNDSEPINPSQLRSKLDAVFQQHITNEHHSERAQL